MASHPRVWGTEAYVAHSWGLGGTVDSAMRVRSVIWVRGVRRRVRRSA